MAASAQGPTASEYVIHHLTNWNTLGHPQKELVNFSVLNIDTLIFSVGLGMLAVWLLYRAAAQATSGVPGRFQAFVEMLVETVNDQAKAIVHHPESRKFVAPLALTLFVWIFCRAFGKASMRRWAGIRIMPISRWCQRPISMPRLGCPLRCC